MTFKKWAQSETFQACLFFILVTAAVNYEMLLGNHLPYYGGIDVSGYILPEIANIYQGMAGSSGWYPFLLCGVPAANFSMGVFFNPIQLLPRFFPILIAHSILIFLYMSLAGILMYIFLRRVVKLRFWAAILGSCIYYCLPSTLCFHTANSGIIISLAFAFFPVLVLLLLEAWIEKAFWKLIVFCAAVSLLIVLTWATFMVVYSVLFACLALSYLMSGIWLKKIDNKVFLKQLILTAVIVLIFLGPYFSYLLKETADSPRSLEGNFFAFLSAGGYLKALRSFITPVFPNFHAPSLLPLLGGLSFLSFLAIVFRRDSSLYQGENPKTTTLILFSIMMFISLVFFTSANPLIKMKALNALGSSFFYVAPLGFGFAASIMCAMGFDRIESGGIKPWERKIIGLSFLVIGLLYVYFWAALLAKLAGWRNPGTFLYSLLPAGLSTSLDRQYALYCSDDYGKLLLAVWLAITILVLSGWRRITGWNKLRHQSVYPPLIAGAILMQGWWMVKPTWDINSFFRTFEEQKEERYMRHLDARDRLFVDQEPGYQHRDDSPVPFALNYLQANVPVYYGARIADGLINVYSKRTYTFLGVTEQGLDFIRPLTQKKSWFRLDNALSGNRRKMLDMLNIKYIFSSDKLNVNDNLAYQGKGKIFEIYENLNALPKFSFYTEAKACSTVEETFTRITSEDFDPATECIVEDPLLAAELEGTERDSAKIREIDYLDDYIHCRVETGVPGIFKVSDSYHRYWHGYVDGREVAVFPVDYIFRGLLVPAGDHKVEMKFIEPLWLKYCLKATVACCLGILALAGIMAFRPR
ncbi:MAG: hypothetical protein A3F83_03335 [Candidatus Glassbacteria bacterium RIFCSPLOWO2_12_FULL_58_11]|uniref:Membrane protein 6-pyruvoyl-tetrahydropterin synthase-related domain-containing protein n=1 Tax=Candidatus Glassbacteria bacterium RIFCSPLOWO2_12_FULL_58_11 TaxID=1817867 RepID=A0A1F5YQZ7_9BACT|nr:MAG: hypothetical protein A3F83_03335 [Candidatus Glassbacteria bacterium RIFCSPLOWO2_12_FULL_58_11]